MRRCLCSFRFEHVSFRSRKPDVFSQQSIETCNIERNQRWKQSMFDKSHKTSDERFYGLGAWRTTENSQSLSRYAQFEHQQNSRCPMEINVKRRETAVLRRTVASEQSSHGKISGLSISTETETNLYHRRKENSLVRFNCASKSREKPFPFRSEYKQMLKQQKPNHFDDTLSPEENPFNRKENSVKFRILFDRPCRFVLDADDSDSIDSDQSPKDE